METTEKSAERMVANSTNRSRNGSDLSDLCVRRPAGQQAVDGKLHVPGARLADLAHGGDQGQHTAGDVLALLKLALGDGAVPKAHAVLAQDGLYTLRGDRRSFQSMRCGVFSRFSLFGGHPETFS